MAVIVICQDSDQAPTLRKTLKQAHLKYINTILAFVSAAGPLNQSVDAMRSGECDGSAFIYDTNDVAVARKLFENDPYAKGGVYSQVSFAIFKPAAGQWIGGHH